MTTVDYPHIELTSADVPMLAGTTMKVVELISNHLAHGWDADELHREFPFLGLGQIHCALGYYYDHQSEMDQDIENRQKSADELRSKLESPALAARLRKLKSQRSQS